LNPNAKIAITTRPSPLQAKAFKLLTVNPVCSSNGSRNSKILDGSKAWFVEHLEVGSSAPVGVSIQANIANALPCQSPRELLDDRKDLQVELPSPEAENPTSNAGRLSLVDASDSPNDAGGSLARLPRPLHPLASPCAALSDSIGVQENHA